MLEALEEHPLTGCQVFFPLIFQKHTQNKPFGSYKRLIIQGGFYEPRSFFGYYGRKLRPVGGSHRPFVFISKCAQRETPWE